MLAITLTKHELLQLKLLLRDIQLIQKMNSPFDIEAIEILSFKVIDNLNNEDDISSQTEISEHRFTEKEIRFAYMQGYNRGVNGNPNHMESYIEHLKSTKPSQTEISDKPHSTITDQIDAIIFELPLKEKIKLYELIEELYEELDKNQKEISDEEIKEAAKDYHWKNGVYYAQEKTFIDAIKWYREQLKSKLK